MRRRSRRRGFSAVHLVVFALALASTSLVIAVTDWKEILPGRKPSVVRIPIFERPVGREYVYGGANDFEIGKIVLYHDLGAAIRHAREADILIFGNSRMLLGFREEFLVPRVEAQGLRIFALAGGHSEQARFPLEIIRKHDLHPKVVIVSGGPHILADRERMSELAKRTMEMTRWEAAKTWLEVEGAWQIQSRLHSILPQVVFFGRGLRTNWIIYFSTRTGWWRPVFEPRDHYPIGFAEEQPASYRALIPFAEELDREIQARGALLVLTMVPYGDTRSGHLAYLEAELGIPAILPDFEGLRTADGSHLDRASAGLVSERFWKAFVARPEVQDRLGLAP